MNKEITVETAEKVQDEDEEITYILEDKCKFQICRICYGSQEEEQLIAPCRCSGTMKYIHQSCLMTWLRSGSKQCEVCKESYRFRKYVKSYSERLSPNITSWHLAWIVKELVVLDWFHFLETAFICISLMIINRMSSFDLVYQFALIAVVELLYYCLNIFSCFFLLYYEKWAQLNMTIIVSNYTDLTNEEDVSFVIKCFDSYAGLLRRNRRLKSVVDQLDAVDIVI